MNRLIIFGTGAALIGIWLYLSLLSSRRSLVDKNSKSQNPHIGKFEEAPPDQSLVKGCFPWAVYFLRSLEYKDQEIICRGNLRGTTDWAYQQIKDNVQKTFGDRFLVLLRPELNPKQFEHQEYTAEEKSKYIFVLVPNFSPQIGLWAKAHRSEALTWLVSVFIGLLPLAFIGFWLYGADVNSSQTLVIVSILIVGLIMRELVRRWVASRYRVKISLPFFAPHLGGLTWYKSHIPNRQALFDLAIAPNLVSLIFGLVLVAIGLQSKDLSIAFDFKVSLLMMGLHQIFSNAMHLNMGLNSVAYAGWWYLNLMAISLIPVSILDGGYIFRSMVGARSMAIATPVMRFVILGIGLVSQYWLMAVALELFLLNYTPSLPLDDATELNLGRDLVGMSMLGLGLAMILPVPEFWLW